jgi:catalase
MRTNASTSLMAMTLAALTLSAAPSNAKDPEAAVDALNAVFGKTGARASHAKGQCVKGTFAPTADAAALTKSASFAKDVPVLGRFSMGGGNPKIADGTKTASRGFAFKLDPDGKATSEFAFVSAPVNFVKDLNQFEEFLKVRVPGADGKPDAEKVKAFGDANPETKRQGAWLASKPVPASYAGVNYWGIHAYTATNAKAAAQVFKFKLVPAAGELGLTDDEAKAKPADFLVAELTERLAKGPAKFELQAIMAVAGDTTNDPTVMWTDEDKRKPVSLGTLSLSAIEPNATCDAGVFDPTILADGLAGPKDDPLFAARSPAYAISLTRRAK